MENLKRVLLLGRIMAEGRALLEARDDIVYEMLVAPSPEEILEHVSDVNAIVVRGARIDAELIAAAPRLEVVTRHGVGYDSVDVDRLTARGIPLAVTGAANSLSVVEHTFALMLAVAKNLAHQDREVRAGNYDVRHQAGAVDIAGKTILVVGFGRIGTRMAQRCQAFDMVVVVADPFVPRRAVEDQGYRWVGDFREALGEADIVTLHLPGNRDRSLVLGAAEIAAMKPGAILVNCARGSLVEEEALAAALADGRLKGAGLDVTRVEPPGDDHPYLGLPNVVLTPHTAAATPECMQRMSVTAVQNTLDALDGKLDPTMCVNEEVLGEAT